MRFNAFIRSVALVAAVLLLVLPAFAQSDNSTISGIVKDPSGAAIANAKVVVKNEGTGFERQTTTNETGFYTVTNIAPGYYSVAVGGAGFKTFTTTRNKLEAAIPIAVNVDLAVGQMTEIRQRGGQRGAVEHRVGHGRQDGRADADSEPCR